MKKEEFIALGISEELATKAASSSKKELESYIKKEQFDAINIAKNKLEADIVARDVQLTTLKNATGDVETLKTQIASLQTENQVAKEKYDSDMKELKIMSAIKLAVSDKAHDSDLVAGLFDKEKLILSTDGKITGLEEQLKTLKEGKAFLFKEESSHVTIKGGTPAAAKTKSTTQSGTTHAEGYGAQVAAQKNEIEKGSAQSSLWGTE